MSIQKKSFWVVNVTGKNVTLSDLNISIPAGRSVDLLSGRYPHLNESVVEKSFKSGSLFIKKDKIVKRVIPPDGIKKHILAVDEDAFLPNQPRSLLEIKEEKYQELEVSDEEFAEQNAEIAEMDRSPILKK